MTVRPTELITRHGRVPLPAFFPDGTRGVVRTVDAQDLRRCGVPGIVVNTLHLTTAPGVGLIKSQGGIHAFMGWDGAVISDSGGFQAMSMIRENARYGRVDDAGIMFVNVDTSERSKLKLTPEKSIQIQFALGSDIIVCLDDCPNPDADREAVEAAVRRTVAWAQRCRAEYDRQLDNRQLGPDERPLLFAVIQGGFDRALRQRCAEGVVPLGFDGFGLGGWPLDAENRLAVDILAYTAELMPDDRPKYALGVGSPEHIIRCVELGYTLFDCVLPTRDARHHRLYVWCEADDGLAYDYVYIRDARYKRDSRPVSAWCDCHCCAHYSRSYLHHLFEIGDALAWRLATIHNLRFYTQLMSKLQRKFRDG